ncbi:hypothetical protein H0266_02330 [Halobacillus locisalis]|uniref:Uncharacterized protein n=1 Tax=Halobacillus locisalis TaxID=220753 RepID=A0A838CNU1_9BACI|nr:hypothetical protein [Halobacillus locisalis]MBA2173727.1 hypothetical protein [Halobacillus locisalis]
MSQGLAYFENESYEPGERVTVMTIHKPETGRYSPCYFYFLHSMKKSQ